jgi:hypothetical protein
MVASCLSDGKLQGPSLLGSATCSVLDRGLNGTSNNARHRATRPQRYSPAPIASRSKSTIPSIERKRAGTRCSFDALNGKFGDKWLEAVIGD